MFIDITESNFNTTKEIWENNGIKTYDVPISAADCRVEGNDAIITLRLPHDDALYTDYASIMYWIQGDDGSEREESRAGLSVPSSCTMSVPVGDDDVRSQFTSIVSGTTKGLAELRIHCENVQALAGLIAAPKAVTYLRPMWYTGYGVDNALNPDRLTPDNTVVMEDMRDALECSSLLEDRGQILNGKKYLFTFDENVYTWDYPYNDGTEVVGIPLSPSYYEIIVKDGTEDFTGGQYSGSGPYYYKDKFIYSTGGCAYYKMKRMNYFIGESIGYGPDEIEDVLNGNVFEYLDDTEAFENIFNAFNTDEMINLNLRRNGLYLVSGTLRFNKSNICVIGHGSQIKVWDPKVTVINTETNESVYNLFDSSLNNDVKNIELCNLTIQGLMKYDNENKKIINGGEQCFHFRGYPNGMFFPTNMTFYEVNIDGFETGVHITNDMANRDTPLNIRFIDCNVSRTMFGYNMNYCKQVVVSGGSVDNSLSLDKRHHCIYVGKRCSYIVVENCTLKNTTGGAIHQYGFFGKEESSDHNRYRNLLLRNCYMGLTIGGYTRDIIAENITGDKICGFIQLQNCSDVIIRNYIATGNNERTMKVGVGSEHHIYVPDLNNDGHWEFFKMEGPVQAKIEDCSFSDQPDYISNDYINYFFEVSPSRGVCDALNYDEGWVVDSCGIVDVRFSRCKFAFKNVSSVNIGSHSNNYIVHKLVFDKCIFAAHKVNYNGDAIFYIKGNSNLAEHPLRKSSYIFIDCKGIYNVTNNGSFAVRNNFFARTNGAVDVDYGNMEIITSFEFDESVCPYSG